MTPFYTWHVFTCQNERDPGHPRGCCGQVRGEAIRNRFQQELRRQGVQAPARMNKAGCLDRCELGPVVVVYPEGVWYRIGDLDVDVEEIVREHFLGGKPVERLRLPERAEAPK